MKYAAKAERLRAPGDDAWQIVYQTLDMIFDGHDVCFMSQGDPAAGERPPDAVIETMFGGIRDGLVVDKGWLSLGSYPPPQGFYFLREAIARYESARTGVERTSEEVVVTAGAAGAIDAVLRLTVEPGDEVVVFEPMYPTYRLMIEGTGARMVTVPLRASQGFHPDVDAVAAAITPRTRVLLMNSPHNPTGSVFTEDEVRRLGELCIEHDLWLISDEVYRHFVYGETFYSPVAVPELRDRTIVVDSVSKSLAMTGYRLGWAVAPPDLAKTMSPMLLATTHGNPLFIQNAVTAIMPSLDDIVGKKREVYRERRDLVAERIAGMPALSCVAPEGTIYMLIDVSDTGMAPKEIAQRLLKEHKLSVLAVPGMSAGDDHFIRWALTPESTERHTEGCDRLEAFLRTLG